MDEKTRKLTEPKQVIVVRRDLNMSMEKFSAQTGHAILGSFMLMGKKTDNSLLIEWEDGDDLGKWVKDKFTKVILMVKSEEKLLNVYKKAEEKGLPVVLIKDAGHTVFNNIPTYTCLGIGPVHPEKLIGVTDKLRLYKS